MRDRPPHLLLARLRAEANWRRISEELWEWTDAPPSTPIGEAEADWLRRHPRPPRA